MAKWGTFIWGDSTKWGHAAADYPHRVPLTIKIADTDRTDSIDPATVLIEEIATKQDSRASFIIKNGGAMGLAELDAVIIAGWEQEHEFAGYIWKLEELSRGVQLDYRVDCTDYTWDLQHPEALVDEEYTSKSDQYIIQDFMATSCPGIEASTYVEEVSSDTGHMSFDNDTPFEVIERLAEDAGAEWYVDFGPVAGDPTKWAYLHYFDSGTNAAPYSLSDSPDLSASFPYENLSEFVEAPLANKVLIAGKGFSRIRFLSTELDSEQGTVLAASDYLDDDGQDFTEWGATGANAQYLVMAETDIGATTNYPVWAYLGQATSATRITVNRDIGLAAAAPYWNGPIAPTTIVAYSIFDANSDYGRWITAKLVNLNVTSSSQAISVGDQFLAGVAASTSYSLETHAPGLRAGQNVTLVNSTRNINASFMIMVLSKRFERGGLATYTAQLGKYIPSLAAIIARDSKIGGLTGTAIVGSLKAELAWLEELLIAVDEGDPIIEFNIDDTALFTLGVDDSDSDKWKISLGDVLGVDDVFMIDSLGNVEIAKDVGDPILKFDIAGTDEFTLGVDDSDSNKFKIDAGGSLGDYADFQLADGAQLELISGGTDTAPILRLKAFNDQTFVPPHLYLQKSHTDSVGVGAATIDTEILGAISFLGHTGGAFDHGVLIRAIQDGAAGTFIPTKLEIWTYSATGNNLGLWIDSSGNVGGITGQPMFGVPGILVVADDQAPTFICGHPNGLTLVATASFAKTAPTGAAITFDIELSSDGASWATIYSVLPSIADGSRFGTDGTLSTTTIDQGNLLRLNIDQIGSTIAGAHLTVSLRVESR